MALALMRTVFAATATLAFSAFAFAQPTVPAQVTSVVTGGHWQRGAESGWYRAVIVQDGWEHLWSRLFVEWIAEPKSRDEDQKVIARVEPTLPFAQGTHVLEAHSIRGQRGRAFLTVTAQSNNRVEAEPHQVRLELGAPGQVKVLHQGSGNAR